MRAAVLVLVLAACGDESGSGVARNRRLVAMTDAEIVQLCEYTVSLGPIEGHCANGEYVSIGRLTVDECVAQYAQRRDLFGTCTATVGDAEDCTRAFLPYTPEQLCANQVDLPASCVILYTSECGGL